MDGNSLHKKLLRGNIKAKKENWARRLKPTWKSVCWALILSGDRGSASDFKGKTFPQLYSCYSKVPVLFDYRSGSTEEAFVSRSDVWRHVHTISEITLNCPLHFFIIVYNFIVNVNATTTFPHPFKIHSFVLLCFITLNCFSHIRCTRG